MYVRVTWGIEPDEDDRLRTSVVPLAHLANGKAAGLSDRETLRRLLAIKELSGVAAARFVQVYEVEPVAA